MNAKFLVAGIATIALAATGAQAATHHKHHMMSHRHMHRHMHGMKRMSEGGAYAAPAQPIPYAQLDAYTDGARHERGSMGTESSNPSTPDTSMGSGGTTPPN